MVTPRDIITYVEKRTGHPLNADEGVIVDSHDLELKGVSVVWIASPGAIRRAAESGHNCIIHHEALTYPCPGFGDETEDSQKWPTNKQRLDLLKKYRITALRIHGSADEICIFDRFADQLMLGKPITDDGSGHYSHKVFSSPVPTFGGLIDHVKKTLRMEALRVTRHPAGRPVNRIGLPWGGLGLFVNVHYVQRLIEIGVDTLICGETDNYGFRFVDELDIAVIETSHEVSESEGLREFAAVLNAVFDVDVRFADTPCGWEVR